MNSRLTAELAKVSLRAPRRALGLGHPLRCRFVHELDLKQAADRIGIDPYPLELAARN